jgi:hypothetical protein
VSSAHVEGGGADEPPAAVDESPDPVASSPRKDSKKLNSDTGVSALAVEAVDDVAASTGVCVDAVEVVLAAVVADESAVLVVNDWDPLFATPDSRLARLVATACPPAVLDSPFQSMPMLKFTPVTLTPPRLMRTLPGFGLFC